MAKAFESVSTWRQGLPARSSPRRTALVAAVADRVVALSAYRLRVAVDGRTAAGKTTFGHELAAAVRDRHDRPTARASLDDFKHPWRHSREHGYDRITGAGYYRNAFDLDSARRLLLEPVRGTGVVALCAFDPLTGVDHRGTTVALPDDAVLIVDGVFAFRPELDEYWDLRIWLEITAEQSIERGVGRDADREGAAEAERLHRDRYGVAESIYLAEVDPAARADLTVDNTDWDNPVLPGV